MSLFIKVYDDKFIPSLGRGPILKPTKVSEELYRTLRILGYTTEKITMNFNSINKKNVEDVKEDIVEDVKEDIVEDVKEDIVEDVKEESELNIDNSKETIEQISIPIEIKHEKKDYSQFSNSQLRNILKENNIKFSNASSREKLLELANNNLKI